MDSFGITIAIIVFTTLLAAYIRRVSKDKCLKNFEGDCITLEYFDGTVIKGKLDVENTGLELIYTKEEIQDNIIRSSHIVYSNEYVNVHRLIRYHDELSEKNQKERDKELKRTYHPNFFRRTKRRIINFFKLLKDSLMEIGNTITGKLKTSNESAVLADNEKYTKKVNQELVNNFDASYDPLLEKYIGNRVVLEIKNGERQYILRGILKDYTQNYIEILDVDINDKRKSDAIFQRKICTVRNFSEKTEDYSIFSKEFDIKGYKKFFKKINIRKK